MSAKTPVSPHQHEAWQIRADGPGGKPYCAACGEIVTSGPPTCPECGKTVTVLKSGVLRSHTGKSEPWPGAPYKSHCDGSGKPPTSNPVEDSPKAGHP